MCSRETLAHAARARRLAFALAGAAALMSCTIFFAAASRDAASVTVGEPPQLAWRAQRLPLPHGAIGLLFAARRVRRGTRRLAAQAADEFEERKREAKEQDGDPIAQSRRRSLHRALSRSDRQRIKDASFVVVNPTHVAVALEYRPPPCRCRVVLVQRRRRAGAARSRVGAAHRIPIVENVPLARALYRDAKAGVPSHTRHYVAVAEVVAALVRSEALELKTSAGVRVSPGSCSRSS